MPDRSELPPGNAGLGVAMVAFVAFCVGVPAVVVGVVSLVVYQAVKEPNSPYRVHYSQPGKACKQNADAPDSALILDDKTGEVLYCGFFESFGELSEADRREVQRTVESISRANGHEKMSSTLTERITGRLAWGIAVGLGVFACMGLLAHYMEQE
ncbi:MULTISPECIES: hypothetical protein [Streptomyces]|uniref:hypothetical protein n=1 Tax=Streptomyces TaxID=1883 RepID=UPI00148820B8|nr:MULTISPECIES: hypothetical protein [Streptomyces]